MRAFFERGNGGDERFYCNSTAGDEIDGLRIFAGRSSGALQADLATHDNLQRNFDSWRDVADQGHGAAALDTFDGGFDGGCAADGFQCAVHACTVGEPFYFGHGIGGLGVDGGSGTEVAGEFEPGVVYIGNDSLRAAGLFEGLQNKEADHAGADNHGGAAFGDVANGDCVDGDGERLDHGGFFERDCCGKGVEYAGRHNYEIGEGSGAAELGSRHAENFAMTAKINKSFAAVFALAAVNGGVESDAVAFLEVAYGGADGFDAAGGFVAHDKRRNAAAGTAVVTMDVAAADAAGFDADKDFVWGWLRNGEVGHFQLAVFGEQQSFHHLRWYRIAEYGGMENAAEAGSTRGWPNISQITR